MSLQTSDGDTITVPAAGVSPSPVAGTGRTVWQAVYTVQASDTTATPPVPAYSGTINRLDVTATDAAGNGSGTISRTLSGVTIDNTRPDLSGTPTIISNNSVSTTTKAGINNTITVEFTLSEAQKTGVDPTVKLRFGTSDPITVPAAGVSPSPVAGTGRTAWRAVYTVQASDTTATPPVPAYSGAVTLNVEAEDAAGNTTPAATPLSHRFATFTIDNTAPTVSITAVESDYSADTAKANLGSKLLVKFTASDAGGIRTPASTDVTVTGIFSLGVGTPSLTSGVYQVETRELTASDPDGSTNITASVTVYDLFGNSSTDSLTRNIDVDTTMPDFSGTPTITGGNAGIGDTITVNFTLNEAQISTSKPTVSLQTSDGDTITVPAAGVSPSPVAGTGRTVWQAVYTVQASDTTATPPVPAYSGTVNRLDVTATDAAGNRNPSPINRPLSGVTIDNTAPDFSTPAPTIDSANADGTSNAGNAGIGDTITVNFTLNEAQISTSKPTVSLQTSDGDTITVPAAGVSAVTGRTAWRAVYTVPASSGAVPAYSGTVNRLDVTATDAAGNSNGTISRTLSSGVTIDNTAPTLSITGTSAPAIKSSPTGTDDTKVTAGDRAEVTFTASDTGSGISTSSTQVVFTVGGNTLTGTVTGIGTTATGNNYRARTRVLTASDLTFQGTMTATVRVFDNAGNSHSGTPTAVTGSVTVDTVAPAITGTPTITSNYTSDTSKAGDGKTITVEFTLSESQKTGVNPTVTLQAVTTGGTRGNMTGPVTMTDQTASGSTPRTRWRAVYTVPSTPAYSGAVSASISARDGFDNPSTLTPTFATGLTVDNTAPTFTPGLTITPPQPSLGYTALRNITIEVTGVSSDATSVAFTFNSTNHSATKVGTTNTWRTASVAVPASTGPYPVDVKVVDGHDNETNTAGAASIRVR